MITRVVFLFVLTSFGSAMAFEGYYQSPSLKGDTVVFTAEGDLWHHTLGSGEADRLTTHPSFERSAAISPDGRHLAFVADYEGVSEVYVMPMTGGVPKRLTYENSGVEVQGWSSKEHVLFTTMSRLGAPVNMTLKTVSIDDLSVTSIPLADANEGALDNSGDNLYFTQFGLQWYGDNAHIYRGGMRGKLWRYGMGSDDEAIQLIPDHIGDLRSPMTDGNTLYFISDAGGRDNIWSANLDGTDAKQVSRHEEFSVRDASLDAGRVVYQLGADLHLLNLATGDSSRLNIQLASDHPGLRESWVTEPLNHVTAARLAGSGEKVTVTARGKIAVAGVDQTRLVTVATPLRSRMRNAALSRDGKWVYAISGAEDELELWRFDATGGSTAERLIQGGNTLDANFFESPDGNWIAHDDGRGGLWLLNTKTKKNRQIVGDSNSGHQFGDLEWAADSSRLAVSHRGRDDFRPRILLHNMEDGKQAYLSSQKYESGSPTFSRDGQWLYYLSNRNFESTGDSVWRDRDFGPSFDSRTEVFAHALTIDAEFPFRIPTELTAGDVEEDEESDDESEDDTEEVEITVDWDGLSSRVWQVPVAAGDYSDIIANEGFLYLVADADGESEVKVFEIDPLAELKAFTDSAAAIELSDDGKKLMVAKVADGAVSIFIVPAEGEFPDDVSENTVQTQGWRFSVDPKTEWMQIFNDAWLMHREQFFDPDMRGVDWENARDKYAPLIDRVADRRELNDVLSQMMGELNALHSQVRGGDAPSDPDAPTPSVLGAVLKQAKNGVEIEHIYRHESEVPSQAPPLAMPGVDAVDGDLIVAINGVETPTLEAVHRTLRNQAGKQVLLKLMRDRNEIQTVVVPTDLNRDFNLRYYDWVHGNRSKVETTDTELGYVHLQAMGARDVAAFARDFYASDTKKGMVIDVRRNFGGNVDSWIIDRLMRKAWMFWSYRSDKPYFNLQNVFRGHLVVIADAGTYSDGETFTAAIKALDIAPVIGKRTAGAGVWLSGRNRLTDSGIARVAEFPAYRMDGEWIVEGRGVDPTIEVDNLPHATYKGTDAQLEAAIEYLQQKIVDEPVPEVEARPFPEFGEPAKDVARPTAD